MIQGKPNSIECSGCRRPIPIENDSVSEVVCPSCGTVNSVSLWLNLDEDAMAGLRSAINNRRNENFDEAKVTLLRLLRENPNFPEAEFEFFLCSYEVTDYSFDGDKVKSCNCFTTKTRPVSVDKHLQRALDKAKGPQYSRRYRQWRLLSDHIEKLRERNGRIFESIPNYRAILVYNYRIEDPNVDTDGNAARGIYEVLSKKTDVFFAPVSLQKIPTIEERVFYLKQILHNPNKAPLMFVIYSDEFEMDENTNDEKNNSTESEQERKRKAALSYYQSVGRQCRDFYVYHGGSAEELASVTCNCDITPEMRKWSKCTIECGSFEEKAYTPIANAILGRIVGLTYNGAEKVRHSKGELCPLNGSTLSPLINPLKE